MTMVKRVLEILALLFVLLGVFGALFWPTQLSFILDDLLFPFAVLHVMVVFLAERKWRWIIVLFVAMCAWGLLSDVIANGTLRTAPIGMLARWLKWPLIIVTLANCSLPRVQKRQMMNAIQIFFLALVAINVVLLINPFHFGESIHYFYAPKSEVLLGNYNEFGAFRLSGTMMNPNNNAAVLGLFLLFFLNSDPKVYWKYAVMAFALIFLTQSRTVLIIVLVLIVISFLRKNSRRTNLVLIPSGIIGMMLLLLVFRSTNLISVFTGQAFGSSSWSERMDHYTLFFDGSLSDKMLGHGIILNPLKTVGVYFDSEYLSILYQYGIVGMLIWVAIVLYLPMFSGRIFKLSAFGWMLALYISVVAVTNFVFLNVEVITTLCLILGVWLFLQRQKEVDQHAQKEPT